MVIDGAGVLQFGSQYSPVDVNSGKRPWSKLTSSQP
jgi:hypothetical protein